jgi:hypothetical protein
MAVMPLLALRPIPGAKYGAPPREAYQAGLDATAAYVAQPLKEEK